MHSTLFFYSWSVRFVVPIACVLAVYDWRRRRRGLGVATGRKPFWTPCVAKCVWGAFESRPSFWVFLLRGINQIAWGGALQERRRIPLLARKGLPYEGWIGEVEVATAHGKKVKPPTRQEYFFGVLRDEWKGEITIDNTKSEMTFMICFLRTILFKLKSN